MAEKLKDGKVGDAALLADRGQPGRIGHADLNLSRLIRETKMRGTKSAVPGSSPIIVRPTNDLDPGRGILVAAALGFILWTCIFGIARAIYLVTFGP